MIDERQAAAERIKARDHEAHERLIDEEIAIQREHDRRAAADEAERQRRARVRAEIGTQVDAWMRALAEAENGAIKMAEALREAVAASHRINALVASLGIRERLSAKETADRTAKQISRLLAGIVGPTHFGGLTLDIFFMIDPGTSWVDGERRNARWLAEFQQGDLK
jgi:hypothetical protein